MKNSKEPSFLNIVHYTKEDITLELIEECYQFMALIVDKYGDTYLPIFIRLHKEIEKRKEQDQIRILVSNLAKKCHTNSTQTGTHFLNVMD